jgi:hypothetical protein
MSSFHIQKCEDNYFYIKEFFSYRDELGKPRNTKISVDDPDNEQPSFYAPYLVEKRDKEENIVFNGIEYIPNKLLDDCLKLN